MKAITIFPGNEGGLKKMSSGSSGDEFLGAMEWLVASGMPPSTQVGVYFQLPD